jgi:hypothetical protein
VVVDECKMTPSNSTDNRSNWSLKTPSNNHRRFKEYSTLETIYEGEGDDCDDDDEKVHGAEEESLANDKSTLECTIMGMFITYLY